MATSVNKARQIRNTIQSMIEWQTKRIENLLHKDLGKESFIEIEKDITLLTNLLKRIVDFDFETLHENLTNEFSQLLNIIHSTYPEMQNYFGGTSRDALLKKFDDHYKALFVPLVQIVAISGSSNYSDEWFALKSQIDLERQEQVKKNKEWDDKMAVAIENYEALTSKNKDSAIKNYAAMFESQAKSFKNKAYIWLVAGVIIFGMTLWLGFSILTVEIDSIAPNPSGSLNNSVLVYFIVQQSVAKILIASALFYALSVCIKNSRANLHNQTINQHRSTALSSFQAFSESPADEQTRSAVLLEATKTIFSHQHSGFSTSDKDSEMSSKIIEIIKPIKTDN